MKAPNGKHGVIENLLPAGWGKKFVFQVGKIVSGGTPSTTVKEYWDGDIPWCTPSDLSANDSRVIARTAQAITEAGVKNSSAAILPIGAIVVCTRATIGECAITGVPMATNQGFKNVIPSKDNCGNFLFYALQAQKPTMIKLAGGSTFLELSKTEFERLELAMPPLSEQTKIGKVLTCADDSIEKLKNIISLRTHLLDGLMQQLLSGKTRFNEFTTDSWRTVKIGSLLEECDRYVSWSDDTAYRFASIRRRSGGLFDRGTFYGREVKTKVLKLVKAGDFLISKRQVVHGAWAMVTKPFDGFGVSDEYDVLVNRDTNVLDIRFFNYLSQTRRLWHMAYLASNGVHIEKLIFNFDDFAKEKLKIPPTVAEQKKIADVLSACDLEIELLEKQLESFKEQKRGLMQKLLTGKVRVKI